MPSNAFGPEVASTLGPAGPTAAQRVQIVRTGEQTAFVAYASLRIPRGSRAGHRPERSRSAPPEFGRAKPHPLFFFFEAGFFFTVVFLAAVFLAAVFFLAAAFGVASSLATGNSAASFHRFSKPYFCR